MGRLILVPYRLLLRVRDIVETGALCTAPDRPMQRDTRGRALIIITGRLEKPEKKMSQEETEKPAMPAGLWT